MNRDPDELDQHPSASTLRLALRARAAMRGRDHALEEAVIAFDSSALAHVRDEDRFERALEDAETAESLADAMTLHEADIQDWTAEGMALLRTVQGADEAYERDLGDALDHFRNSVTGDTEENDD